MTPGSDLQQKFRRYLLGQLDEQVVEETEKEFLLSDDAFEALLAAEDDLIDDYLAGNLNAADRAAFDQVFRATSEHKEQLKFGGAFRRYLASQPSAALPAGSSEDPAPVHAGVTPVATKPSAWWLSPRSFFTSPWRAAAFAVLLLALGFGVWQLFVRQSAVEEGLLALNSAFREQRPLEARISSFSYAPYIETRGPGTERIDHDELLRAELKISEAKKNPSPAVHYAQGKVYLAKKEFDNAIKEFNEALKGDQKNAELSSDVGAAWLEKGRLELETDDTGNRSADFGRALEFLNKAIELDSRLLEAKFNRALCFQLMHLPEQAKQQWRDYLTLDSTSPWAQEAQRNLKQLEHQDRQSEGQDPVGDFIKAYEHSDDESAWLIVSRNRDLSGGPVANRLIDRFLDSAAKNHSDQSRTLGALSYVARLEKERAGDYFVQDVVNCVLVSNPANRNSMIEGRRILQEGRQYLMQANDEMAAESLNSARNLFQKIGCASEAIYAEYPLGHSLLGQKKSKLGLEAFENVVRAAQANRYKWLMAQALNAVANTQIGLTNHSAALKASEHSLMLSKEIGDTNGVIKTTNQLASQYFRLGNYRKALGLHQQTLSAASRTPPTAMQMWRNYFAIAKPLEALGFHSAAIEYEKEALRRAEAMKQPTEISRSYSVLGLMYAGDRNYGEGIRNANAAIAAAQAVPGSKARQEALAYSTLQLARIYRQSGDSDRAISNYDHAINAYRELDNFAAFSYVAHKGKLLACIKTPACTFADQEIKTALDLFEKNRANIREVSNRLPFFDTEQDIYDIAADYEFGRKHFEDSFMYSEQARARTVRELTESKATLIGNYAEMDLEVNARLRPMTFNEIKTAIPSHAQVLQFTVLQDKLIIWLVSNSDFLHQEQPITFADLDQMLQDYSRLVSSPSSNPADLGRVAASLYDVLIRPIESRLAKEKLLVIVPDKTLEYVPFASLMPASGKYLVDDFDVMTAASSTMFVSSSANSTSRSSFDSETLLSVGNPHFDRAQFDLADLPSAEREAREITGFYTPAARTTLLVGPQATKLLVAAKMRQADVVHLALHSIVDEQSPFRSRLVLARDNHNGTTESGVLHAYEIYGTGMPITRLVVLSACDTGAGRYYAGEGTTGLSKVFIAAGVPLVVATLWSVDSNATADLMIEFHRLRKTEKLATATALRKAQQKMAHTTTQYNRPYYWAGFTVSGGYATF